MQTNQTKQSNQYNLRFIVKFNNGTWKTFDTWNYCDVETFPLCKDAIQRLIDTGAND